MGGDQTSGPYKVHISQTILEELSRLLDSSPKVCEQGIIHGWRYCKHAGRLGNGLIEHVLDFGRCEMKHMVERWCLDIPFSPWS